MVTQESGNPALIHHRALDWRARVGATIGLVFLLSGCMELSIITPGSTSSTSAIVTAPARQLELSGTSTSPSAGSCSRFTVTALGANFSPTNVPSALTVNLSGADMGAFYADSGCTVPVTGVQIAADQSAQDFYYLNYNGETSLSFQGQATGATPGTLAASSNGWGTAVQSSGTTFGPFGCVKLNSGISYCWSVFNNTIDRDGTKAPGIPLPVMNVSAPVQQIATPGWATCALRLDGKVQCWGDDWGGGLFGNGVPYEMLTATSVPGLPGAVSAFDQGDEFACAVISNGSVSCWGQGWNGELGNGRWEPSGLPGKVSLSSTATAIATSVTGHACALLSSGGVQCWGGDSYGETGDGALSQDYSPFTVQNTIGTGNLSGATAIVVGDYHSCALISGGGIQCWGYNGYGQLGNGSTTNSNLPVSVAGLSATATAVAAGGLHTCALLSDTTVECWGYDNTDQLGDEGGSGGQSLTPVHVLDSSGTGNLSGVIGITAGYQHTCALLSGGGVQCWGYDNNGQTGDSIDDGDTGGGGITSLPQTVPLSGGATAIASKYQSTCALLASGSVQCWGYNGYGQLGNGSTTDSATPVTVSGLGSSAISIAAGQNGDCSILSGGGLACWGANFDGEIVPTFSSTPVTAQLATQATAIASGDGYMCALLNGGSIQCWGTNTVAGNGGTAVYYTSPTSVSGLSGAATALASGGTFSCALIAGGAVQCWGDDSQGELGNGTTSGTYSIATVTGLASTATAIATGYEHACALLSDGTVQCWGYDSNGQLGNGSTGTSSTTPVSLSGGLPATATAVATGQYHSCALLSNGGIECWGANSHGQLGNDSTTDSSTPVAVTGLAKPAIAIATGPYYTIALLNDSQTIQVWGQQMNPDGSDALTPVSLAPFIVSGPATGLAIQPLGNDNEGDCTAVGVYPLSSSGALASQLSSSVDLTLSLTASGIGSFFSDSACTQAVTSSTLLSGTNSTLLYYVDTNGISGTPMGVSATDGSLSPSDTIDVYLSDC